MLGGLTEAFAIPGLVWVVAVTFIAGVVYGFAGFGAALIFMPVATVFLVPSVAVAAFSVSAIASLVTVVPRAWGQADRRAVMVMIGAAVLTAPLGLYILRTAAIEPLRWAVAGVVALTLIALMLGWRYEARPTMPVRGAIGAATGFVGGATGLLGPIMVLFQLGGQDSVAMSRANALVFLTLTSLLLLPLMALQGILTMAAVWLGLVLLIPYGAGARLGQALFTPGREHLYRQVAYGIIAAAVVLGLPVWEG